MAQGFAKAGLVPPVIDHGALGGLADNDHAQYVLLADHIKALHDALALEHGSFTGLGDDDHPQYVLVSAHTKAAHDALALDHGLLAGLADDDHPQYISTGESPSFPDVTVTSLTALRLMASDAAKALVSVPNLASWIAGIANQIVVTNDGDGSVTLSAPQDLAVASSPTFAGLTLTEDLTMATGKGVELTDYQYIPIGYAIDGETAPDTEETISSTNKVKVRKFQGATADMDVFIPWHIPSDLIAADGVKFRVLFIITEATVPSNEGVVFGLKGASLGTGDDLGSALGTAQISEISGRSDPQYDILFTAWSSAITVTDLAAGELAMFNFYRDQDHASDTYAQKVGVIGIELLFSRKVVN